MARQVYEQSKSLRQISLYIGSSFDAAWENVLLPWFESVAQGAVENRERVGVVTALGSHSAFLREKLLDHRISLLGVKFLSPPSLREILLRESGVKMPLREHLRLLLATAAEEFSARAGESARGDVDLVTIAKSGARDPAHFFGAIDQFVASGCGFADAVPPGFHEFMASFLKI